MSMAIMSKSVEMFHHIIGPCLYKMKYQCNIVIMEAKTLIIPDIQETESIISQFWMKPIRMVALVIKVAIW